MLTAYGGVPLLIEAFRVSGAARVLDERVAIKRRQRGLRPSELVEGRFTLWAAGGERCEDLAPLREDTALALLAAAIRALPESAWRPECEDGDAVRRWAEVPYVPSDGVWAKDRPVPPRYLAIRITKQQGRLFADGGAVKHFAIVTNRSDPEGGSGLDLIRWQRGKAGTVEHAHHVLTNELAAEALPSQKFGANAAWFRLNVLLYNLLSAFKRVALPEALHTARPKRLRFVLLNGIGKVVRHARETVLRRVGEARRQLADGARLALAAGPPLVPAV